MQTMEVEPALSAPATIVVRPEEGTTHHAFGDTIQVKLGREHTNGTFSICLGIIPPGEGPPPHRHNNEDEVFLVQEGQYQFLVNGEWVEVGPGSVVYLPRGVVHTFKNTGNTTGRAWVLTTPCGFESFFGKCAAVFTEAGADPPDMQRILSISDEHGIEYVPPLSPPSVKTAL